MYQDRKEDAEAAARGREQVNRTVRFWRHVLRVALLLLFVFFLRTLFVQLPQPALSSFGAYVLLKLSFAVYVYLWYYGCTRDLHVQNDVLRDAPKPAATEVAVAAVILAAFAFLFYVENPRLLSVVFVLFLAADVGGWVFLRRLIWRFAEKTRREYREAGNVVYELKTLIFQDYLFGKWKWWRFAIGFGLLTVLTAVAFDVPLVPGLTQDVAFSCIVALTICVLEVWIWYRRLRLKNQWDGLDWINSKGFVVERRGKESSARAHV